MHSGVAHHFDVVDLGEASDVQVDGDDRRGV
jgi:hypothetical protein